MYVAVGVGREHNGNGMKRSLSICVPALLPTGYPRLQRPQASNLRPAKMIDSLPRFPRG
jgi:hypothetical protein